METDSNSVCESTCVVLNSVDSISQTKFDETVVLTKKQFSEYFPQFPYAVRKSLNKTSRGELTPVSNQELLAKRAEYLGTSISESISNLSA